MKRLFINKRTLVFLIAVFVVIGFVFWFRISNYTSSMREEESSIAMQAVARQVKLEPMKTKHSEDKNSSELQSQDASPPKSDKDVLRQKVASFLSDANLERQAKGREIIGRLQSNFNKLNRASYDIQWESLNDDKEESSFLAEVKFKRPYYYFEKGTGGRVYTYFSEGMFEQFTYDAQAHDFVGKSEAPKLDAVNEGGGFLERFPLRILQTKNPEFVGEETAVDPNGNQIVCDVVRNGYWQIYVAKNNNTVIRADYYRELGKTENLITSLSDFKYSKVEMGENKTGEKKFMDFPVSFKAVSPSTNYVWKCNISNLQVNDQNAFDDSVFKFGPELDLIPEFDI